MTTDSSPAQSRILPQEGARRARLAEYFLSALPFGEQTPAQRREYRACLREMGTLENEEILVSAGTEQTLVWGDPLPLLQNLSAAAQQLAATAGQPLLVFPANGISIHFTARMHPRLLCAAAVNMLRMACTAAPRRPVWLRMEEQAAELIVSVTAEADFYEPQAAAVVKESARLHGGSLALGDNRMSFSCARAVQPPAGTRLYAPPAADTFLRDSLSPVWTGFYAWLSCEEEESSSGEETVSDAGAAELEEEPEESGAES